MVPMKGTPIKAAGWEGEGVPEGLFHLVPRRGAWGEESGRGGNQITLQMPPAELYFSFFMIYIFLGDPRNAPVSSR